MMNKKLLLISIICVLFAGCVSQELPQETVSETEMAETTAYSETTWQTTEEDTTTEETKTTTDLEKAEPVQYTVEIINDDGHMPMAESIKFTADTKIYECEYTQDKVIDGKEYSVKSDIENAVTAFTGSDVFKELEAKAETEKNSNSVYDQAEFEMDIGCRQVLICDFDGDGMEEKAYLLSLLPIFPDSPPHDDEWSPEVSLFYSAVDINSSSVLVLESSSRYAVSDCFYASNAEIYELRYNGFSHIVVDGGVSNNSSCADFFSFEDGKFELELREFRAYDILDNAFIAQTMAQTYNMWLIFWNEENRCYVTPEVQFVSTEDISGAYYFGDADTSSGSVVGNSIYSFMTDDINDSYIITDNGVEYVTDRLTGQGKMFNFDIGERHMPMNREYEIPLMTNFDYNTALKNRVPLTDSEE